MPRGWSQEDPEKGVPHRHVRAKIRLLLGDHLYGNESAELLGGIVLKVAEKHPETVLDAVLEVTADEEA